MKLGRFTIEQLGEGQFEFFPDGTINRKPVSQEEADAGSFAAKTSSQLIGINPLYISDGTHHILLDTGLGWGLDAGSDYQDVSNIKTNLDIFGVAPKDITHVILSHLHYEHAAGASFTDNTQTVCPTFRNATYFVQQSEWDFALSQVQHQSVHAHRYQLDDLYRLYADSYFKMIRSKITEIIPGITLIRTGGHTPGHQIIKITDNQETGYFFSDLVSTEKELNNFDVAARHVNRLQTKKMKINLLQNAFREHAVLFFYHSLFSSAGRLLKDEDKKYVLKELDQ